MPGARPGRARHSLRRPAQCVGSGDEATVVDGHAADAAEGGALTRDPGFVDRYGPWALVAGASEGVGAAYARAIAERGLNVALLARRQEVLDEVASSIRSASGVETRTLAIDLSELDAAAKVLEATAGLDIGQRAGCLFGKIGIECRGIISQEPGQLGG